MLRGVLFLVANTSFIVEEKNWMDPLDGLVSRARITYMQVSLRHTQEYVAARRVRC